MTNPSAHAFSIIKVAGIVFDLGLCPLWPSPLTPRFLSLLHKSFHLYFCLPLCIFAGTGASDILISMHPSSSSSPGHTWPTSSAFSPGLLFHVCHIYFWHVRFWSYLSSWLHTSISTSSSHLSSLFSWLFIVDHVSAPYTNAGRTTFLCIFSFSFTGIFLSHNTALLPSSRSALCTLCSISKFLPPSTSQVPEVVHLFIPSLCSSMFSLVRIYIPSTLFLVNSLSFLVLQGFPQWHLEILVSVKIAST